MAGVVGRIEGAIERGKSCKISLDGEQFEAFEGETLGTVMMAMGKRTMRRTAGDHSPRGMYCGIGVCFDCLIVVDGVPNQRACQTVVKPGMKVLTQVGFSDGDDTK